jgi:hypothetical protein
MHIVVYEELLENVFSKSFCFSVLVIIPLLPHARLSSPHKMWRSPEQAAHYHTVIWSSCTSVTRHFAALGLKVVFLLSNLVFVHSYAVYQKLYVGAWHRDVGLYISPGILSVNGAQCTDAGVMSGVSCCGYLSRSGCVHWGMARTGNC